MKDNVFGQNLRFLRKTKGLKQIELANMLSTSPQNYSAFENGREPNFDSLIRIADLFNVTIDYLLGHNTDNALEPMREEVYALREKLIKIKSIV
ncbi:MAG: helix-turn-helix domain-containing protein [Sporomusa sp.]